MKFVSFPPGVSTHPRLNLSRRIAFWRLAVRTWVTWGTFVAGGGHGGAVYAHYNFKIQSLEVVHEQYRSHGFVNVTSQFQLRNEQRLIETAL